MRSVLFVFFNANGQKRAEEIEEGLSTPAR